MPNNALAVIHPPEIARKPRQPKAKRPPVASFTATFERGHLVISEGER